MSGPGEPARRSRAQQRQDTVDALLEATMLSLVEVGLSATTTRGIAERAGVSQGAMQHHFASKAALVDAAIDRFVRRAADAVALPLSGSTEEERAGEVLDRLWEAHRSPVFGVVDELLVLARTHPETAGLTARTAVPLVETVQRFAAAALPTASRAPEFHDWVLTALVAVRGTAMVRAIAGAEDTAPSWPALRHMLLAACPAHT